MTPPLDPSPSPRRARRLAVAQGPGATRRICDWCSGPIELTARRDAVTCSQPCRQARARFLKAARGDVAYGRRQPSRPAAAVVERDTSGPLRLAYADPPYPGNAHLYRGHPDYAGEVPHAALIERLAAYDGWALSTSAAALPDVLRLCPPGARVAAWHKGERPTSAAWPLSAWEPVIYSGGRQVLSAELTAPLEMGRRVDSITCGASPLTTLPGRVIGAKPARVCAWIFSLLGARPGDVFDDLFPGSGSVGRAWRAYTEMPAPATSNAG